MPVRVDPADWKRVLAKGRFVRGQHRVSTRELLERLGVPIPASDKSVKQLRPIMQELEWHGPQMLRFDRKTLNGYWRPPTVGGVFSAGVDDADGGPILDMSASDAPVSDFGRDVAPAPADPLLDEPISADAQIGSPPALVQTAEAATTAQEMLPRKLEAVTLLGLQKLEQILRIPTNHADGNLLRAQVTAAGAAIHAQVRVDETKMRQRQQGDVLERLLKVMAEEKKKRAVEENEEGAISLKICGRPATNRRTSARRMAATCTSLQSRPRAVRSAYW